MKPFLIESNPCPDVSERDNSSAVTQIHRPCVSDYYQERLEAFRERCNEVAMTALVSLMKGEECNGVVPSDKIRLEAIRLYLDKTMPDLDFSVLSVNGGGDGGRQMNEVALNYYRKKTNEFLLKVVKDE